MWAALQSEFSGGPAIPVPLSPSLVPTVDFREVYITPPSSNVPSLFVVPATATVGELKDLANKKFSIQSKSRLRWITDQLITEKLNVGSTLESARIYFGSRLRLEVQQPDGTWTNPRSAELLRSSSGSKVQGVKGLPNLGNSCYLNAVLQCLVHSPLLFDTFFRVNRNQAPAGHRITDVFARFLNQYWRHGPPGRAEQEMLQSFKRLLSLKYATWEQQDPHEFLSDFLTALEKDGRVMAMSPRHFFNAEDFWAEQCRVNQSRVFGFVHGVASSHVTCPACGNTTDEAFELTEALSLPILEQHVTLIPKNRTLPALSLPTFAAHSTVKALENAIADQIRAQYPQIRTEFVFATYDEVRHILTPVTALHAGSALLALEVPDRQKQYFAVAPVVSGGAVPLWPFLCAAASAEMTREEITAAIRADLDEFWKPPVPAYLLSVSQIAVPLQRDPGYPRLFQGTILATIDGAFLTPERGFQQALIQPRRIQQNAPGVPLTQCLQAFLEPDVIDADNAWQCQNCGKKVCAEKRTKIWRLPPLLIIHLGRFRQGGRNRAKVKTNVLFDDVLDMAPYVEANKEGSLRYRLFAVIEHIGESQDMGHHVACAKNHRLQLWHRYNDDCHLQLTERGQWHSQNAYILFYERIAREDADE
jgi:ubiquitin C-terminal hydrolase